MVEACWFASFSVVGIWLIFKLNKMVQLMGKATIISISTTIATAHHPKRAITFYYIGICFFNQVLNKGCLELVEEVTARHFRTDQL
jgi:hypothetical protein